jgi:hypothetical protein
MADAHVRVQVWSLIISVPALVAGLLSSSAWWLLALSAPFVLLSFPFLGYANAGLQLRTPPHLRGRVSAMFLAIVTAVGTLFGAPLVGLLSGTAFGGGYPLPVAVAVVSAAGAIGAIVCLVPAAQALRRACT